jgi:GNAT superfamily N-acetyltransferase
VWEGLLLRSARPDESDLLADLVLGDAEQETTRVAMKLYGLDDIERVRSLFRLLWKSGENWRQSLLALSDGEPVAVLQRGRSGLKVRPRLLVRVLRTLGPVALVRMGARMRYQSAVSPKKPVGAYVISELHVAANARGKGIGGQLLTFAEDEARSCGFGKMALHTLTTNPARHLYARNGFVEAAVATDARFEALTGAAGNVLMLKDLAPDQSMNS